MEQALTDGGGRRRPPADRGDADKEQVGALEERERRLYGDGGDVKPGSRAGGPSWSGNAGGGCCPATSAASSSKSAPLLGLALDGDLEQSCALRAGRPGALDPLLPALEQYPGAPGTRLTVHKPEGRARSGSTPASRCSTGYRTWSAGGSRPTPCVARSSSTRSRPSRTSCTSRGCASSSGVRPRSMLPCRSSPSWPRSAEVVEDRLVGLRQTRTRGRRAPDRASAAPARCTGSGTRCGAARGAGPGPPRARPSGARGRRPGAPRRPAPGDAALRSPPAARFRRARLRPPGGRAAAVRNRLTDRVRAGDAKGMPYLEPSRSASADHRREGGQPRSPPRRARPDHAGRGAFLRPCARHSRCLARGTRALRCRSRGVGHADRHGARARHGALVTDVSRPEAALRAGLDAWPGFDVWLSIHAARWRRYIEVKGRAGVGEIELTDNEWARACNLREKYWLYVVFDCAGPRPRLVRVRTFGGLLVRIKGRIAIDVRAVLAAAEREVM